MRIGIFAPAFEDFGGVQHILQRLNACMIDRGHELTLVTRKLAARDGHARGVADAPSRVSRVRLVSAPYAGVGLRGYRRFLRRFLPSALAVARQLRQGAPDVVVAHCSKFYAPYALVLRWLVDAPLVVHLHNGPRTADGPESPFLSARLVAPSERVVACSPAVAGWAQSMLRRRPERVVVVPYGVDHDEILNAAPAERPTPFVLGVGRLAEQKGFDILVEAFAAAGLTHDLVLAGDGPDRDQLLRMAAARGIAERLHVLGIVDRPTVASLLRGAAIVAIPSRFEGYPQVSLEAMLAGAPIVVSNLAVMPVELRDGESGLRVPSEDPAALARALRTLAEDPGRARSFGRAAQAAARRFPGWTEVTDRILAEYAAARTSYRRAS